MSEKTSELRCFYSMFNPILAEANHRYFPKYLSMNRAQLSTLNATCHRRIGHVAIAPIFVGVLAIIMGMDGFLGKTNHRNRDESSPSRYHDHPTIFQTVSPLLRRRISSLM